MDRNKWEKIIHCYTILSKKHKKTDKQIIKILKPIIENVIKSDKKKKFKTIIYNYKEGSNQSITIKIN